MIKTYIFTKEKTDLFSIIPDFEISISQVCLRIIDIFVNRVPIWKLCAPYLYG